MHKRLSEKEKLQLVECYQNGETVLSICDRTGISRSTFYSWIGLYSPKISQAGAVVTPKAYDSLKRKAEKLKDIIKVLKCVDCTANSPLQDKLVALETLHGDYSFYVLCEALDVSRATFYNHIFRNKRNNSMYEKRKEELRVLIKKAFDENRQLFGAAKIKAILNSQGHAVGEKMVSTLMKEMGLQSVRTTSK